MSDKTKRYNPRMVTAWQTAEHPQRPWMATANRNLNFRRLNRKLGDHPPSVVLLTGYRLFLFKSGFDRDLFVENFHKGYEAKVYAAST